MLLAGQGVPHTWHALTLSTRTSHSRAGRYPVDSDISQATNYINYVFTCYFALEMIVKVVGLGPKGYVRDRMNIFDAIVTVRAHGCRMLGRKASGRAPSWTERGRLGRASGAHCGALGWGSCCTRGWPWPRAHELTVPCGCTLCTCRWPA